MCNPFSHDRGHVAVESDEEAPRHQNSSLLSVLEVGGRMHWRVADALDLVGLTQPEYELLAHLRTDSGIGLDRLASVMRRSIPELSPLVDELSDRGFVRTDGVAGGPAWVTLTPSGWERAREGRMRLDAVLHEFAERVGLEERVALDRLLAKLGR